MRRLIIDKRYKILKALGAGAMGVVYKVRDLKNDSVIALKLLSKEKTSFKTIQRFTREFKLLTELHHPNLCEVYDFGTLRNGRSYFTMEYIDGPDIFKFTKNLPYEKIHSGRKNISSTVYPLIVQLCRVLEYIHSRGLIHYDVKPDNVLIQMSGESGDGRVKLMDFGLAGEQRIKGGILIKGTFPYIAPEIIKGLAVDQRADLFSLGVLLYEIFTRKKFQIKDKESFVTFLKQQEKIVSELPSKIVSDIPKRLEKLIMRLLEFEPTQRFSRANEVINEINKISGKKFEVETEKTIEGYLMSSKFVGRDREMRVLQSLYEKTRHGEGKVVLMTGDAGIGKSRLLKEFSIFTQLRRSHSFIGYTHKDKTRPLEPFHDIFSELINYIDDKSKDKQSLAVLFKIFPDLTGGHLRRHLPKLVPLEPQAEKLRTLNALTELIKYCAKGLGELVILLEDLHWSDVLSVQFLEYLGRNLTESNVFICGTCRREELDNNPTLIKMISDVKNEDYFTQIELKPLKFRSFYSFLDSTITSDSNSLELARYLMKKTCGNPYFVEEIMRTLMRTKKVSIGERVAIEDLKQISIPETIEEVTLKRFRDLDSNPKSVLKYGAVLLKDFSYDLMKRLTGLDNTNLSRALWELKRRQVLIEEDNRYRYYHATLREAVNKRMAYRERRRFYYQVGKTLEIIHKKNTEKIVEDLAYYFINAGDRKKGVTYGLQAAQKSSDRYANEQAIQFYRGVLELLGNKNPKVQFDILPKLAQIEDFIGYNDDAIKHYNKALNMKLGTINEKIEICCLRGDIYKTKGEFRNALHSYQKALKFVNKMKPGCLKVLLKSRITGRIYVVYYIMADHESAFKLKFDDLTRFKGLKSKKIIKLLADAYRTMGLIELPKGQYTKTGYDKAVSYFNQAYKYYKKMENEHSTAAVLVSLCMCYFPKFEFQKGLRCYQKSMRMSEKLGNQNNVSSLLLLLGNSYVERGNYPRALDCFQKSIAISKKIGNPWFTGYSLYGIGRSFLKICNFEKAKECCAKTLKIYNAIGLEDHKIYPLEVIGAVYQAMGNYNLALKYYRKALNISRNKYFTRNIGDFCLDISSCLIEIGEISKAKKYSKEALELALDIGAKDIITHCYINLCRIDIIRKDYASANDYYKKGITISKKLGLKLEVLQFSLLLSEIYYHEKRYLKGIRVANKAINLAKEMGTKDLHAKALLMKVKNGVKQGSLSKIEVTKTLDEAKRIAEEIGCPEILWRVYFEYGRHLQNNKEYLEALDYYQKCNGIFRNVISKIKNKSYRKSYFNRPDRQAVLAAINEIEKLLH